MTSSWADANRFGPGYLNGWAVGPESQCVSAQRAIRSNSLAQRARNTGPTRTKGPTGRQFGWFSFNRRMTGPLGLKTTGVGSGSWADANRFGPGYLNGWAVGPESQCVSDQGSIRSHSLAQSEAAGQVIEPKQLATAQRANRSIFHVRMSTDLSARWAFLHPNRIKRKRASASTGSSASVQPDSRNQILKSTPSAPPLGTS